jgi:outer membrane immunogenic protein
LFRFITLQKFITVDCPSHKGEIFRYKMMKKFSIAILVLAFSGITALAQCPLSVGKSQVDLGVGLSSYGIPVYAGFDYCFYKDFTVGGEVSARSYRDNWHDKDYNLFGVGLSSNANYHFNSLLKIPSDWDFYAGLNLGFYIWSDPDGYDGSHATGLGLGMQVGGRYYINDKIGLNLEFGGGNEFSGGKFGVSIRL